jgi:hypothetical protein
VRALIVTLAVFVSASTAAHSQESFTCRYGTQPACLDTLDQICDGISGMCVKKRAICFDEFACGGFGSSASDFVCKKKAEEVVDELEREFKKMQRAYETVLNCVANADSLDEAQGCN